jgi:hypothetical protein
MGWALKKRAEVRSRLRVNHLFLARETANCKLQTANCKLQTANCKLQTANCKLQTANCKLQTVHGIIDLLSQMRLQL